MVEEALHEKEITSLVELIRARKAAIADLTKDLDAARDTLEKLLIERGSAWKDEYGYAMLTSEGERVSYDTKALDELILSDPLKHGWLYDYRRKSAIAASLKVK